MIDFGISTQNDLQKWTLVLRALRYVRYTVKHTYQSVLICHLTTLCMSMVVKLKEINVGNYRLQQEHRCNSGVPVATNLSRHLLRHLS